MRSQSNSSDYYTNIQQKFKTPNPVMNKPGLLLLNSGGGGVESPMNLRGDKHNIISDFPA